MQTETPSLLDAWMRRWRDLMDFELVPVLTSAEAARSVLDGGPE